MSEKSPETALALMAGPSDGLELLTDQFDNMLRMGQFLINTGLCPTNVNKPETAVAMILAGRELGFGLMASLRSFHVVEGKPVMEASAQLARAIQAGVAVEWKTSTDKEAVVRLSRNGLSYESRWTWAMAERQELIGRKQWKKSPEAMLRARAITAGIRAFCPDVLGGGAMYDRDEVEHLADEPRRETRQETTHHDYKQPAIDAEYTDASKTDAAKKEPPAEERLSELGIPVGMLDGWRKSENRGGWETLDEGQRALLLNRLSNPEDIVRKRYDAFAKAYREFEAKENEPPKEEPPPDPEAGQQEVLLPNGHHPHFTEKWRKRLNAELNKLGLSYEDYARFHETAGRGRPSTWNEGKQSAMLQHLQGPGLAEVRAWLEQNPAEGKGK